MPPPHRAQRRRTRVPAALGHGRLARAALAGCAAACFSAAIPLAGPAPAAAAGTSAARQPAGAPPVSVVIASISPGYASPGRTVTVRGTVTNASTAPIRHLLIQLSASNQAFQSRDALKAYAAGSTVLGTAVPGAAAPIRPALAPRATASWSIRLPVRLIHFTGFGVYPLAAQAVSSVGATLDASRTFLPYWPGKGAARPLPIAWVWPLIDQPRQSPCPGSSSASQSAAQGVLVNDSLAASLAGGGRLAGLLAAGASYAAQAHLTWAIDPALLANAATMTGPYLVSGNGQCTGALRPASRAARSWLAAVKAATSGQPVFVTPYADADSVALIRQGLETDLTTAFTDGRLVAGKILGRDFRPGHPGTGADARVLNGMAWPPAGIADYPALQSLAGVDGISSVIMDSTTMPPRAGTSGPPTASAQTTTPDGEGPDLHVLLADHALTTLLGSAGSAATTPGGALAVRQYYLAQTAMIAAEAPNLARSVIVAPPARWDPPASLARALLAETVGVPWLHPVSAARLAAARSAPGRVSRQLSVTARATTSGLRALLRRVRGLDQHIQLLQSILVRPDPLLPDSMASAESAAWQGGAAARRPGEDLLETISSYVSAQESGLTLISPGRVTLGGLRGSVPVSISNQLDYPVMLRLQVSVPHDGSLSVQNPPPEELVPARTVKTLKFAVSSAAVGSTTLSLSLLTPAGVPLPGRPVTMTVQATHYGTLALVIIAAALGVFMLTSATRAVRRGRSAPAAPATAAGAPGQPAPPLEPAPPQKADNVESGHGEPRRAAQAPEDADEYVRTPGRADRH
jgi:hypothetical protein